MTTPTPTAVPAVFDASGRKLSVAEIRAVLQASEVTLAAVTYEFRTKADEVILKHGMVIEGFTADDVDHITITSKETRNRG